MAQKLTLATQDSFFFIPYANTFSLGTQRKTIAFTDRSQCFSVYPSYVLCTLLDYNHHQQQLNT